MDPIVKRLLENHKIDESKSIDFNKLVSELKTKMVEVLKGPSFGFSEEDIADYSVVELRDGEDYTVVEVRGELSYSGMEKLSAALDPILSKYDEDAYFDFEDAGILVAYFEK